MNQKEREDTESYAALRSCGIMQCTSSIRTWSVYYCVVLIIEESDS